MRSRAERTCGKAVDCAGKLGLANRETKDSKSLAVKYCGGCKAGKPPSVTGVCWKVGLEGSEQAALLPL